ncbi:hypothetical protein A2818_01940 [Candidatus Nomurabacteria bacterium RIFCSPHIGHO2_01_FULL_40_12]|uniref:Phosphoglycerate mutase n=1 Tax=Candidatus Nomurabacteria bacterium RIFCSPHIGHO2_01_FULL_40_12 TaxID=1801737 RepID=A0A1F6V2A2_9BACT|nr:MAG: hypothetical protein A2818_01940 [Candidatus Nomurabacteria bacterium RIFCSPHIGHO2_01_FULL_40_12]
MKIYVVRHGLTEFNKKNLINGANKDFLVPEGKEQARATALLLPNTIKRIYSSSFLRAKQTAEIFNEKLKVLLTFHDELQEVNFGDLQGTPYLKEYRTKHINMDYDWRPSGESVENVKKRVLKILEIIERENKSEEALIVAHGGIIRMMHWLEFNEPMGAIENASVHSFNLNKILRKV